MPESDVRSVASQGRQKEGGVREEMNSSSAIRLLKTEETVSHRQNIGVKEEGTPSEFRSCVKVEVAVLGSPS